mgnify:CR=1 FL=1
MVDLSILKKLFETDEMVFQFLNMMVVEIPKSISEFENYILEKDFVNAAVCVHTLKSHFGYIGNDELSVLAQRIEIMCEQTPDQSLGEITVLMTNLKDECEMLVSELEKITS